MRGALISIAGGLAMAVAHWSGASAASTIQDVAREKAEAVSIVRGKARKYAISLAQGRLFSAYLTAATQGESDRLKAHIMSSLRALQNKYGMKDFTVVDRVGTLFIHVGNNADVPAKFNIKATPTLARGFRQDTTGVTAVMDDGNVTYVSPVIHNGEKEFVLRIEQDMSAYEKVLALGLAKSLFVVIIDVSGNVISDSHNSENTGKKALIAGMTFDVLRHEINGSPAEGTGVISKDGRLFNVSYQTVDDWTVVAIEQSASASPSTCLRNGNNPCQ